MKNWIYIVIWKKANKLIVDGRCFNSMAEAQTYGNIETTQMEAQGWSFGIQSIELV